MLRGELGPTFLGTVGGGPSDQKGPGCLLSGPLGLLMNSSVMGSSAFHGPPLSETALPRRKFSKLRVVAQEFLPVPWWDSKVLPVPSTQQAMPQR